MRRASLAILAVLLLFGGVASAQVIDCSNLDTLQAYIDAGACQLGDKIFSDFWYDTQTVGGDWTGIIIPTASDVGVNTLSDPMNPGLQFQSVWRAPHDGILDVALGFNVYTVSGAAIIHDASLLVGGSNAYAILGGGEDLCLGGPFSAAGGCADPYMGVLPVPASHFVFPYYTHYVGVQKDISLQGSEGEFGEFSLIEQRFSQVPEPATCMLMGTGLLALGFRRRFRRR